MPEVKSVESFFERLATAESSQHLGHALILEYGKTPLAQFASELQNFLQYLTCENPNRRACNNCESCRNFQNRNLEELAHPDLQIAHPSNENGDYTVDEIKEIRRFFSLARAIARNRVICILGADGLSGSNAAPANALLKILEEPRPNSFLVLITRDSAALLPTIRSRCQNFRLPRLSESENVTLPEDWQSLSRWLDSERAQVLPGDLPPFQDSYWKDREIAIQELKLLKEQLWAYSRVRWATWSLEQGRRNLAFFQAFDGLLGRLDAHGNAGLQWLAFSRNAISDSYR